MAFAPQCYTVLLPYGSTRLTVLSTSNINDTHCIEFSHIKGFKKNIQTFIKNTLILQKKLPHGKLRSSLIVVLKLIVILKLINHKMVIIHSKHNLYDMVIEYQHNLQELDGRILLRHVYGGFGNGGMMQPLGTRRWTSC